MRKPLILAIAVMMEMTGAGYAQDWQFLDESDSRLPDIESLADGLDGGDVDGDGAIDLIVGCSDNIFNGWPGFEQLFINNGWGYFALVDSGTFPWASDLTKAVLLFDSDGDSDLDSFVGNFDYTSDYIAINDGTGYFVYDSLRIAPDSINAQSAAYADVNDDGAIDICVLNNACSLNEPHTLWINNGLGFYQNQNYRLPPLSSCHWIMEFGDVDNDLDPDMLLLDSDNNGHPLLLINDGQGYYSDETDQRLPSTDSVGYRSSAKFMDFDEDGDFDILLCKQFECLFFLNDGSGHYSEEQAHRGVIFTCCYSYDEGIADLNNDGLEDLVLGVGANHSFIFINTGNGYFEDQTSQRLPIQILSTRKLFVGDLDDDGDADFFRVDTGNARNNIYINTLNVSDSFPPAIKNQTILPAIDTVRGPYPVKLIAKDGISIEYQLSVLVHYSLDGNTFVTDSMHYTGGFIFHGNIPEVDSGETVYYYYTASDREGNISRVPEPAPDSIFSFTYLPGYVGIGDDDIQSPNNLSISAYPNPFNSRTVISFKGDVDELKIFNLEGRLIKRIRITISQLRIIWNASDDSGQPVSSGIYFARAYGKNNSAALKLIYLK